MLNTESSADLRKWLMQQCRLKAVFSLPSETFKPNKINVKSSLLYFERRSQPDIDLEDCYKVTVCQIGSLGYHASGDAIRGFNLDKFLSELSDQALDSSKGIHRTGYKWEAFDVEASDIAADFSFRLDYNLNP
ncbi:hypothetical protein HLV40_16725 [Chromohalobacter salexigens]|nr:hypothetical protein [Chromohalobacter salexigens]